MPTLDQVQEGKKVKVIKIKSGLRLRHRLAEIGIHPGDIVGIVKISVWGGPILIGIEDTEVAIGRGVAQKLEVEVVE